jgi:hypothetical protein
MVWLPMILPGRFHLCLVDQIYEPKKSLACLDNTGIPSARSRTSRAVLAVKFSREMSWIAADGWIIKCYADANNRRLATPTSASCRALHACACRPKFDPGIRSHEYRATGSCLVRRADVDLMGVSTRNAIHCADQRHCCTVVQKSRACPCLEMATWWNNSGGRGNSSNCCSSYAGKLKVAASQLN